MNYAALQPRRQYSSILRLRYRPEIVLSLSPLKCNGNHFLYNCVGSDQQKALESWKRYLRMDNSKVVDIFVGQLKSTLRCTSCGHCSVTFDPFWDLSLPIPVRTGQVRLQQCFDHFTREEVLDGDEKPVSMQHDAETQLLLFVMLLNKYNFVVVVINSASLE